MDYLDDSAPIRDQLGSDEHLLWNGRPRGGVRFRSADLIMLPFSLMWGGFAFFWEWSVVRSGGPLFFMLWGIPFVLVGLYLIVGRFFWDARQRANTYYGLTNQRVLIVTGARSRNIQSLSLRTLTDVTLSQSGGSGTIRFGPELGSGIWFARSGWPGSQAVAPTFDMIDDAKRVYELIRQAQRSA